MTTLTPELYRVWLPYAVFGIVVQGGFVRSAAPIGKWMVGKNISYIQDWVTLKQGEIENLGPDPLQGVPT